MVKSKTPRRSIRAPSQNNFSVVKKSYNSDEDNKNKDDFIDHKPSNDCNDDKGFKLKSEEQLSPKKLRRSSRLKATYQDNNSVDEDNPNDEDNQGKTNYPNQIDISLVTNQVTSDKSVNKKMKSPQFVNKQSLFKGVAQSNIEIDSSTSSNFKLNNSHDEVNDEEPHSSKSTRGKEFKMCSSSEETNNSHDEACDGQNANSNQVLLDQDEDTQVSAIDSIVSDNNGSKCKTGIIYFSHIPPGIDVARIREIFSQFGEIGRIYLEKDNATKKLGKKTKFNRYIEGWLEFKKKKVAKKVAAMLNGQQVGGKRRNVYFDSIWSIKYLHRFKWHHLKEQRAQEKALNEQRLRFELEQARKETNFYLEMAEKRKKKKGEDNIMDKSNMLRKKQKTSDEVIRSRKQDKTEGVDLDLLERIFN